MISQVFIERLAVFFLKEKLTGMIVTVKSDRRRKDRIMSGYFTYNGYMGYVDGKYMLFASEADYADYMEE